jgi:hypothetical protein
MKKVFFAMFVAVMAAVTFSACTEDVDITLSDIAGATFEGKDSSNSLYSITFGNSSQATFEFTITDDGSSTPDASYTGTYSIVANDVTLTYSSGNTVEHMYGDGANKLLYSTVTIDGVEEQITLKKK